MNTTETKFLLDGYVKSLLEVQYALKDLNYHIQETIDDIEKMKEAKNYEGAWVWHPDQLMGHSYRVICMLKSLSDIYEEDYKYWGY